MKAKDVTKHDVRAILDFLRICRLPYDYIKSSRSFVDKREDVASLIVICRKYHVLLQKDIRRVIQMPEGKSVSEILDTAEFKEVKHFDSNREQVHNGLYELLLSKPRPRIWSKADGRMVNKSGDKDAPKVQKFAVLVAELYSDLILTQ